MSARIITVDAREAELLGDILDMWVEGCQTAIEETAKDRTINDLVVLMQATAGLDEQIIVARNLRAQLGGPLG